MKKNDFKGREVRKVIPLKVKTLVVECPKCGRITESALIKSNKLICPRCGHPIGDPKTSWKEIEVDAIQCDKCGEPVTCLPSNYALNTPFTALCCPRCNDSPDPHCFMAHIVAIHYKGYWRYPQDFFKKDKKNGLLPVKSERDRITLHLLVDLAKIERYWFLYPRKGMSAKILWINGEAVGYYLYNKRVKFKDGFHPTINQIFVRKEHRRKGYATEMIKDLLKQFPDQKIGIESPEPALIALLNKLGLTKEHSRLFFYRDL